MPDPARGEIWLVDWSSGRGSEQLGRRPAVIVQIDPANRHPRYPNTIMVNKGVPLIVDNSLGVHPQSAAAALKCLKSAVQ